MNDSQNHGMKPEDNEQNKASLSNFENNNSQPDAETEVSPVVPGEIAGTTDTTGTTETTGMTDVTAMSDTAGTIGAVEAAGAGTKGAISAAETTINSEVTVGTDSTEVTGGTDSASVAGSAHIESVAGSTDAVREVKLQGRQRPAAPVVPRVPGPEEDAEIEKEINEALGDISLMDIYGMEEDTNRAQGLQQPESTPKEHVPGVTVGKVIAVTDDGAFVDLGGKSQGLLPSEEIEPDEQIEPGSEIKVAVVRYDARDGLIIVSRKAADQQILRRNLKKGSLVEARVTGFNKGGLEMDIKGMKAFMPASQIDIGRVEDFTPYVNNKYICEVTQVERGDKNIILSRRNVLYKQQEEKRKELWNEIEPGQMRHGTVRSLMDYGAFVDIGGADGLLHVREMSWARIKHPSDILSVGQKIDVVVIGVDREKQRIALSLRQAGGDPWTTVEHKYPVGSRHTVQISQLADFGAFAELETGVEGLIPISQMSWAGRIRHPSDVVEPGAMVEVEVLSVDVQKRRISLSMKSVQDNPWDNIEQKYIKDEIYTGTVERLTDFGAFVTLEPGVDGLIHISEMSEKHVNRASDVLEKGQEIQVKVKGVDASNRRISLTLKGLAGSSDDAQQQDSNEQEKTKPAKKKNRPMRGGLDWNW